MSILSKPPPPPHVLPLKDEADQHVFLPPLQVQVKSTSPASLKSAMPIALSISSTLACSLSWTRRPVNNHHCRFRYPLGRFHYFLFICFFSFTFFFFFSFLLLEKSRRASTSRDPEKGAGGTEHYAFHYSMHGRGVLSFFFLFLFRYRQESPCFKIRGTCYFL